MAEQKLVQRRLQATEILREMREGLPHPKLEQGYMRYPAGFKRRATLILAPEVLSVRNARSEFLGLIYEHQWVTFIQPPPWARAYDQVVIDLTDVREITLDAALVLTSEFHHVCLTAKPVGYKPAIDDQDWRPEVRGLLKTLGFYELVKASGQTSDIADPPPGALRFVPFKSEEQVLGLRADELLEALREAGGNTPEREAAYAALIEAINNVRGHAYPDDAPPKLTPVLSRWWAAGAYDPAKGVLQFSVYDRGVGIAATLPKQPFYRSVLRLTAPERTDADVIAGAIRYGRSRHVAAKRAGQAALYGRGNGLWTICGIVEELEGSYVRISSGRGEVEYHGRKDVRKRQHEKLFCGTLIEWTLKLPPETIIPAGAA